MIENEKSAPSRKRGLLLTATFAAAEALEIRSNNGAYRRQKLNFLGIHVLVNTYDIISRSAQSQR
jgi:hypothetical protein